MALATYLRASLRLVRRMHLQSITRPALSRPGLFSGIYLEESRSWNVCGSELGQRTFSAVTPCIGASVRLAEDSSTFG